MKLEDQVCNLELSKRLKELGVKQESLFVYSMMMPKGEELILSRETQLEIPGERYAAFTVAELGEMLPLAVRFTQEGIVNLYFVKYEEGWRCGYQNRDGEVESKYADTEADARAKMFVYLLEHDLLSANTQV